jgi:WD40 repeat protein
MSIQKQATTIDPLLRLPVPSPVTSLCFVSKHDTKINEYDSDGDGSDSSQEVEFRSSRLPTEHNSHLLSEPFLVSCDRKGQVLLWDLNQQKVISQLGQNSKGSGLAVKRMQIPHLVMYQTKDPNGTVSILDADTSSMVREYETFSQTFCQAAPCMGDPHLLALPSRQDSTVTVVDDRSSVPVAAFSNPNHGMLTSLAISVGGGSGRPIVACGMESGSILFHDFNAGKVCSKSEINLGKDPVLALDLTPSEAAVSIPEVSSVLAVAGMAGDAAEIGELPASDQGTVSLVKAACDGSSWNVRLRSRMATCRVDDNSYGKPGVSICRFRPTDGRLVAVGGWDYRVRVFERSQGKLMAILRGHVGSVQALDWAPDASNSGLLASSGGDDNQIYIWSCYGN